MNQRLRNRSDFWKGCPHHDAHSLFCLFCGIFEPKLESSPVSFILFSLYCTAQDYKMNLRISETGYCLGISGLYLDERSLLCLVKFRLELPDLACLFL